jgi:hypothetical protein
MDNDLAPELEESGERARDLGWPVHLRIIGLQAELNDLWGAGRLRPDPLVDVPVDVDARVREAQAHLLKAQEALHGLCEHRPA